MSLSKINSLENWLPTVLLSWKFLYDCLKIVNLCIVQVVICIVQVVISVRELQKSF